MNGPRTAREAVALAPFRLAVWWACDSTVIDAAAPADAFSVETAPLRMVWFPPETALHGLVVFSAGQPTGLVVWFVDREPPLPRAFVAALIDEMQVMVGEGSPALILAMDLDSELAIQRAIMRRGGMSTLGYSDTAAQPPGEAP